VQAEGGREAQGRRHTEEHSGGGLVTNAASPASASASSPTTTFLTQAGGLPSLSPSSCASTSAEQDKLLPTQAEAMRSGGLLLQGGTQLSAVDEEPVQQTNSYHFFMDNLQKQGIVSPHADARTVLLATALTTQEEEQAQSSTLSQHETAEAPKHLVARELYVNNEPGQPFYGALKHQNALLTRQNKELEDRLSHALFNLHSKTQELALKEAEAEARKKRSEHHKQVRSPSKPAGILRGGTSSPFSSSPSRSSSSVSFAPSAFATPSPNKARSPSTQGTDLSMNLFPPASASGQQAKVSNGMKRIGELQQAVSPPPALATPPPSLASGKKLVLRSLSAHELKAGRVYGSRTMTPERMRPQSATSKAARWLADPLLQKYIRPAGNKYDFYVDRRHNKLSSPVQSNKRTSKDTSSPASESSEATDPNSRRGTRVSDNAGVKRFSVYDSDANDLQNGSGVYNHVQV